jgi:hypothetical protein
LGNKKLLGRVFQMKVFVCEYEEKETGGERQLERAQEPERERERVGRNQSLNALGCCVTTPEKLLDLKGSTTAPCDVREG